MSEGCGRRLERHEKERVGVDLRTQRDRAVASAHVEGSDADSLVARHDPTLVGVPGAAGSSPDTSSRST